MRSTGRGSRFKGGGRTGGGGAENLAEGGKTLATRVLRTSLSLGSSSPEVSLTLKGARLDRLL